KVSLLFFFPYFWILFLRQKGQFFVHISKNGLKALYYKALAYFLPTLLSTMPRTIPIKIRHYLTKY
ncbi:hypothetical protein F9857_09780, partial [Glaesserella parasuis]|nr:hypothetical protein [Glaesserella parasuis]MWQ80678.1 hypothetical protein [Glaesserella parasuis]